MNIESARPEDIARINEIIRDAKRSWNYPQAYLDAALPLLEITPQWLAANEGYLLNNQGFLGLEIYNDHVHLEHLWIEPTAQGRGVGRAAMNFARAKYSGRPIQLLPDPPAEGFYLKLGALFTGVTRPSRVVGGPVFREMIFQP